MNDDPILIERPQDAVDAVAATWAKHHADLAARDETLAAVQAYLEAAATNPDAIDPRVLVADLQKIAGVPQ